MNNLEISFVLIHFIKYVLCGKGKPADHKMK